MVLAAWPIAVVAIYASARARGSLARTTAWLMILPVMFLPPEISFELPTLYLDKERLSLLSIWAALRLFPQPSLRDGPPSLTFPRIVVAVMVLGVLQTVRTNADPLVYGPLVIPGLGAKDAIRMVIALLLDWYVPFVVGLRVFRTQRDLRDLLEVLALCGLIYLPFCLVELRLSPQLNHWVYGFTPGVFIESKRGSGWRPIVFMNHGLGVAMFCFSALAASLALFRAGARPGFVPYRVHVTLLAALVVGCKSMASILYSAVFVGARLLWSSAVVTRVALGVAICVVAFPVLRIEQAFPTASVVELFSRVDEDRAYSLAYRFRHEDALIARGAEKPMFGWGHWGRGFIYSPDGEYLSTTDGLWIIKLVSYGYVGLAGCFALLIVPVFRFYRSRPRMPGRMQALASGLAFIVAAFALDLLPNSFYDLLPVAYAGALFSVSARVRRRRSAPADERELDAAGDGEPTRVRARP
jgi:hypothetical protein